VANFRHLATKKTGLMNLTKGILGILVLKSTYLEKEKLEVARFRQSVAVRRQDSKKYLLVHQDIYC
jgi:hypothetical protein